MTIILTSDFYYLLSGFIVKESTRVHKNDFGESGRSQCRQRSEVRGRRSGVEVGGRGGGGGQGGVEGGLRVRNELQFCFQLLHLHSIVQFCILTHHCASTCRHIRVQVGSHQFDIDRNPFVCF